MSMTTHNNLLMTDLGLIYDSIRHKAKEATQNSPNLRFGVDWSSYWYNRDKYCECMQKIGEENKQIYNINMQAMLRGFYTDYEQKELMMHGNVRNGHIVDALRHFYSACEDAYDICKFMDVMYRIQLYRQLGNNGNI